MGATLSVRYWHGGAATDEAIEAFTEGDCWILAITLSRMADLPVYLVDHGAHWVVQISKDFYLDIEGIATRGQLLRRWQATSLRKVDDATLNSALYDWQHCTPQFERSQERSRDIARRLLDKYGVWHG